MPRPYDRLSKWLRKYRSHFHQNRQIAWLATVSSVFFNEPLVVRGDIRHSQREKRYYALGQTADRRYLFVAFTVRRRLIRVISVRDMNRRELEVYGKHEKANS